MKSNIIILEDKNAVAERAAELFAAVTNAEVGEHGADDPKVSIALAGGTTPRALYEKLSRKPWYDRIPWQKIEWFIGDERTVPADHEDSNFRMMRETLFEPAGVAEDARFRVMTELATPQAVAQDYAECLRDFVAISHESADVPAFDLMLLGMGGDGHTASLFPHTEALNAAGELVVANYVEKLDTWRITVTWPVIRASRQVLVLVTGSDKAEALYQVLEGERNEAEYPAQHLRDLPQVTWLVDKAAAAKITHN